MSEIKEEMDFINYLFEFTDEDPSGIATYS